MNREIELIVLDWEGTVSESGGGRVPWHTEKIYTLSRIIDSMQMEGKYPPVILCTGRQQPYVEAALQAIHAFYDIPSICENGAIFYCPKTKEYTLHPLITPEKEEILHDTRKIVYDKVRELGGVRELGKEYCISVNPPRGMSVEELYTIIVDTLKEYGVTGVEVTHSKSAVDITLKGVNKGSAIEYLSEFTGIKLKNMLGVGDSKGDLPFLEKVGIPTAPANAIEAVKEIAEYVSPYPTTLGVIDILRTYLPELESQSTINIKNILRE